MIPQILNQMILFSEGSLHDVNHLIRVWAYARTIGELESISPQEQTALEIAAIVHDIACPSLRSRYGHCDGKLQETEGMSMARAFLAPFSLDQALLDRVVYLVGHHHTPEQPDGIDYQILLEADAIANAEENGSGTEAVLISRDMLFRTASGKKLPNSLFRLP